MNRKKLQEKLVKIIGGLETDKSFLLNAFITKLFESLNAGQKIKINNLGYFHKIRFKLSSINKNDFNIKDEDLSNIIVFSESENLDELLSEDQIFFESLKLEIEYSSSNNLFSISIGKEFLNSNLIQTDKILIPISQNEYLDLLESKIINLINNSEILENNQSDIPCLNINIEKDEKDFTVQIPKNIVEDEQIEFIPKTEDLVIEESEESTVNDFTEFLSDQNFDFTSLTEERIEEAVETINEDEIPLIDQSKDFDFNFDVSDQQTDDSVFNDLLKLQEIDEQIEDNNIYAEEKDNIIESDIDIGKNDLSAEITDEDEMEISSEISWDKIISEISSDEDEISFENILNEEKELISETEISDEDNSFNKIENLTDTTTHESQIYDRDETTVSEDKDIIEEIISEVQSESDEEAITISKDFSSDEDQDELLENVDENIETILEEDRFDEETIDEELVNEDELIDEKELASVEEDLLAKPQRAEVIEKEPAQGKSNKIWYLLIIFSVLSTTGLIYYFFPQYFQIFSKSVEVINPTITEKNVTKIERDFSIPITYPYPPIEFESENKIINQIKVDTVINVETKNDESSSQIQLSEVKKNIQEDKQDLNKQLTTPTTFNNGGRVSETISKSGDLFVVQIASFKSEPVAKKEADKLKSKGYSAFVERAEIPNRGVWYRVKVGGFKSEEETKNFQLKYSRGEI